MNEYLASVTTIISVNFKRSHSDRSSTIVFRWSNGVEEPAVCIRRQTMYAVVKFLAFVAALGLSLLLVPFVAGAQSTPGSQTGAQKELDSLTASLANGSVASIDILHMPDRVETIVSVKPENLEKWWDCRITIGKVTEWVGRNDLVEIMKSTKLDSNSKMPDLRSAVAFNDSHGRRIGELFLGRYFGRYVGQLGGAEGSVGNMPVKFNGSFANWLKEMIPASLR